MKFCILQLDTALALFLFVVSIKAQYDDKRCICICPSTSVINGTKTSRMVYKLPVPPSKCDCANVVMPSMDEDIKEREKEFCPRCECRYESRNTTTIKVVVIFVIWMVSLLVVYMGFLLCLDPILNKRRAQPTYEEHTDDYAEDSGTDAVSRSSVSEPSHQMRVRPNDVFGRVTHQQDKWKRQVQEQRKNIYSHHTMLN